MGISRESIVCPGCGCLCDDLDVTLEDGRLVAVNNVCLWGVGRFLSSKKFHPKKDRRRIFQPQVRRQGRWQEVAYGAALARAAEVLARARRPVIYGLTNLGSWAQEAALKLARHLRARMEPADLAFMAPYYRSLSRHGLYWAPLEVIRDEADTVLFWGANPLHSCPRHLVRYSVFARGRFTERGVEDRRVAGVDLYRTELAKFCQPFVRVDPGQELDLIQGVMGALMGVPRSTPRVKGTRRLAAFLARAASGVIFCGRGVSYGQGPEMFDRLAQLAAWLNREARFSLFPLSGDFNSFGLYNLFLNELGHAGAPDFAAAGEGVPQTQPLDFQEVDAVLVAGGDLCWSLSPEQAQDLKRRRVPIVALSPFANRTTAQAQVVLPVALAGVEATEIAYRMDGLPVVLRQLAPAALPPDHEVLGDLTGLISGPPRPVTAGTGAPCD
jgi:formylmethanofuran dehydrogenase subunit B